MASMASMASSHDKKRRKRASVEQGRDLSETIHNDEGASVVFVYRTHAGGCIWWGYRESMQHYMMRAGSLGAQKPKSSEKQLVFPLLVASPKRIVRGRDASGHIKFIDVDAGM